MVNEALEMDQVVSSIDAMLHREQSSYQVPDYLSYLPANEYGEYPVDRAAREAIGNWYLMIVERCDMSVDTAAIAVSILDRFASSPAAKEFLIHREKFQLASLAAIYTAIKIHEKEAISPAFVANLSGGMSTKKDVERMEMHLLQTITWLVNPPTAIWFARRFLQLLNIESKQIMRSIESQVIHSVLKYEFCTTRPSEIAAAAVVNALEVAFGRDAYVRRMERVLRSTITMCGGQMKRLRFELAHAIDCEIVSATIAQTNNNKGHSSPSNQSRSNDSYPHSPKTVMMR
ncbi:unnamed protein product [Cylindrotheca closterium]|uniref:Cyclin-like domain-containing protein n=1 Tax=Cylindrotheca closterium TaxID=2856 RepID=A0AAD2JIW6_9STRA|nr:unnamed protein product [Cylindrotheca closterium]